MGVIEFLQGSEAIRLMLELDYDPREDRLLECSAEHYQALVDQGYDTSIRWFVISRNGVEPASDARGELRLINEIERELMAGVAEGVFEETEASGQTFASFRERLEHVNDTMPEIVWKQGGPRERPRIPATVPGPT